MIRALERAESVGDAPVRTWDRKSGIPLVGLMLKPVDLAVRIERRVEDMFAAGLVAEVEKLLADGGALSDTAMHAIGYAEAMDLVAGRCSREDAVARTVVRTRQLAKRQRTWFRGQLNVGWIEVSMVMSTEEIANKVLEHWRKYGPTEVLG